MSRLRCVAWVLCVACASWLAAACKGSEATGGGAACNDGVPAPPSTEGSNCGLPSGEYEPVAVCCPTGVTADSGAQTFQAALTSSANGCGMNVLGEDCGAYLRVLVYGPPSLGPAMLYYYDKTGAALVAVVQREDGGGGDACIAGPADFVEPCDQSCTLLDAGTAPACPDAGDAGREGG